MAIPRRHFLRNMGLMASGFLLSRLPASGVGGFQSAPHNIPVDKKLDPKWVRSLFQRGKATTYLKSCGELKYIGMPVGGLGCGTLYLGGDGKLWLWDIFSENQEGVDPRVILHEGGKVRSRDGANYIAPTVAADKRVLDQGFSVEVMVDGKALVKELRAEDWQEVSFEATYPVATITYTDPSFPVIVTMKAYSPFIPLDADNSGLPATIFSFSFQNAGTQPLKVKILGWLENGVKKFTGPGDLRMNEVVTKESSIHRGPGSRYLRSWGNGPGYLSDEKTLWDREFTGILSSTTVPPSVFHERDDGTLCFAVLDAPAIALPDHHKEMAVTATGHQLTGAVSVSRNIASGASAEVSFVLAWHFPSAGSLNKLVSDATSGHYYAAKFKSALVVTAYIAKHFNHLSSTTLTWHRTWYDSTLPWWFMERTFVNISCLSTTTAHRFASGRFWAWEGVGACEGTCTHVWQYAQAMARIFPAIERDLRERVDIGISLVPETGMIWFRGENAQQPAIDGQAGTVLRFYREHTMSVNDSFLRRRWDAIRNAITFILQQDKNGDGMEDTPLENTLDAVWDGEIAWIVGLCIAAVRAGQVMAEEVGDDAFALRCKTYVTNGRRNMEKHLFNGEYFIHRPDAVLGRKKLGSYNTSHIDQVYGQAWAHQVGLGRVLDKAKTVSALKALWKYNFTPDVGPYIKTHKGGRPYALAGEAGMIMNTNPRNEAKPYGESTTWQLGYFHECMSGFEHQVAAHMMAEGLVSEALILTRAVHDRYHAAKRNPFNEIECSDHYARAMASYGTFITACGFEYMGPAGFIAFAPKVGAEDFRGPFTSAGGWGTYSQRFFSSRSSAKGVASRQGSSSLEGGSSQQGVAFKQGSYSPEGALSQKGTSSEQSLSSQPSSRSMPASQMTAEIVINYGYLELRKIRLAVPFVVKKVVVTLDGKDVAATFKQLGDGGVEVIFGDTFRVEGSLGVKVS